MYDLIAIGELLADMFSAGGGPLSFDGAPGGAPCNVAAQAAQLNERVSVIAKVGDDYFGHYLRDYLGTAGIADDFVTFTGKAGTTLAFVSLDATGNRSFSFYRKPGADMLLSPQDLPADALKSCRCLVYGGVGLSAEPERSAVLAAASMLDPGRQLIAYDPNLRPTLWPDGEEVLIRETLNGMTYANVVKIADDELRLLMRENDLETAFRSLLARYPNIRLGVVTAGGDGAYCLAGGVWTHIAPPSVPVVDTTGAGDSFFGALLHRFLMEKELPWKLSSDTLIDAVRYAVCAGSLTCSAKGAISSMPDHDRIKALFDAANG